MLSAVKKLLKQLQTPIVMTVIICVAFYIFLALVNHILQGFLVSNNAMTERIINISENAIKIQGRRSDNSAVKELKAQFKKENSQILQAYQEQKKKTKEVLSELGQVRAELNRTRQLYVASDKIYKKETTDPKHWYFFKKIMVKNKDSVETPYAWAMFYPYQTPDKQWKTGTYELSVDTKIIETENRDGSFNRYAEVDVIGKNGNSLPAKITNIEWERVALKEKRFYWWNPRLGLITTWSPDYIGMGLDLSLMSYGKTTRDMDWRFMTFGASVSGHDGQHDGRLLFEPVSYNIGNIVPIVENLFVGPFVSYGTDGQSLGVKISIPF